MQIYLFGGTLFCLFLFDNVFFFFKSFSFFLNAIIALSENGFDGMRLPAAIIKNGPFSFFFFKVTFCCTPPICFRFKYLKNKKTGGEHVLKDGPRQSISGSDTSCVRCVTQQLFTLSRLIFLHLSKHSRKKK